MVNRIVVGAALLAAVSFSAQPAAAQCVGDCSVDGVVSVDEIVRAVSIALGAAAAETCTAIDANSDGTVTVDEIITAVSNALGGCSPLPTPTATAPVGGTPTIAIPGCANGTIEATFSMPVDTNVDTSNASLALTAAAEVRNPSAPVYIWGITGNLCDNNAPLARSVQIQLIGPRTGFAAGSYPITPPLGSLVYLESPTFGSVQPRIWQTTGATLVIDSVAGSTLTFHVDAAPMVPNLIVAGDPPPRGTFNLSASGTLGFTSQ